MMNFSDFGPDFDASTLEDLIRKLRRSATWGADLFRRMAELDDAIEAGDVSRAEGLRQMRALLESERGEAARRAEAA